MPQVGIPAEGATRVIGSCPEHPLATSVARVNGAVESLTFRMLDTCGSPWISCERALSGPSVFLRWREAAAHHLAQRFASVPDTSLVPAKTTGGYVLLWYLAIPSYLGALLFHSERRVPSLAPRQLSFRLDSGMLREVALRPGRFWCLPGDPDAEHPDAVLMPDEASLAAVLRREVIAHATRFLTVYAPQVRFGRRTQWAAVTDVLDKGLLLAGRAFGSARAAAADARLVLADGENPLTSGSRICELTDDRGRTHWTRRRGSCCFLYALEGVEHPCASCPRLRDAERTRILATLPPRQPG